MPKKTNAMSGGGLNRRTVLKGAASTAAAAVGSGVIGAPMIWARQMLLHGDDSFEFRYHIFVFVL